MAEPKSRFDELVDTLTQVTSTLVAAHRMSPAQGAAMARQIVEAAIRTACEMTAERDPSDDARAAGAAMVQRQAAQHGR